MKLLSFLSIFEKIYSKIFSEKWDKVGLLLCPNPDIKVSKILLTNDLTLKEVEYAKSCQIKLILCYHPLLFRPLETVSYFGTWQEKVVIECIKHDISVYSIHTIIDNIKNGINDYISDSFVHRSKKSIIQYKLQDFPYKITVPKEYFFPDSLNFFENLEGIIEFSNSNVLESIWFKNEQSISENLKLIAQVHRGIENYTYGSGRKIVLKDPTTLQEIIDHIKSLCEIKFVSVATRSNSSVKISSIGICAGSGASLLNDLNCDLYITGEMTHHDILCAIENGRHVITTNHTNIENPFLRIFPKILERQLIQLGINDIKIYSVHLQDPILTL